MEEIKKLTQCICNKCSCKSVCEYYKETVELIINAIAKSFYDYSFTVKIKDALEGFECEYFE
jgi:hypothetical protein